MNQPLRTLHWRIFRVFRFLATGVLLLCLLGYRGPVIGELPPSLAMSLPENAVPAGVEEGIYEGNRIRVELFTVPPSGFTGVRRWVRITVTDPLRQPDLILYWSTRASTYDQPPLGAQMLGVLDERYPTAWQLPSQANVLGGRLVLYSQGQRVLIAQIPLPSPI
jgi:hypothetical protein